MLHKIHKTSYSKYTLLFINCDFVEILHSSYTTVSYGKRATRFRTNPTGSNEMGCHTAGRRHQRGHLQGQNGKIKNTNLSHHHLLPYYQSEKVTPLPACTQLSTFFFLKKKKNHFLCFKKKKIISKRCCTRFCLPQFLKTKTKEAQKQKTR